MKVGQTGSYPVQKNESSSTQKTSQNAAPQTTKKAGTSAATPPQESKKNISGATAEISPKAKEFVQAKKVAAQAPDVREDRVAELKKKISEGTYRVDADEVADRLVDDHLRMSGIH